MKHIAMAFILSASFCIAAVAQPFPSTLSLSAALAEANTRNPEILAARQSVEIARATLEQLAPAPLQLQASRGLTQDAPQGLGTLQTFSAAASQEFKLATGAQRVAGSAGVRIAEAQFATTQRDVDQRVITAYFGLASAQSIIAADQQNVRNAARLEKSANLRARVGAVGSFEVLRANVELRRAETDLLRAQAAERTARISLNVLLGRSAQTPTVPVLLPTSIHIGDIDALFAQAQGTDPQLAEFRATIAQAVAKERAARLERAPSFGLQGGYLFQRAPGSGVVISTGPTAGVTLSLPLLDYGTIRGAVHEAQARQALARAQLQGRSAQLRAEIEANIADVQSAQARLSFASDSLKQAQEALRLAQFGYQQGALGVLDVLSARSALAAAQSEVTQATADLGAAVARLQLAAGTLISP